MNAVIFKTTPPRLLHCYITWHQIWPRSQRKNDNWKYFCRYNLNLGKFLLFCDVLLSFKLITIVSERAVIFKTTLAKAAALLYHLVPNLTAFTEKNDNWKYLSRYNLISDKFLLFCDVLFCFKLTIIIVCEHIHFEDNPHQDCCSVASPGT